MARGAWQPVRSPRGRHARRSHTQQFARIAVRAVLVALVAGAGYLLLEPFLDGGGSARTLAEDPRPTTTTLPPPANGALPGEDGDTAAASDAKPLSAALLQLADLPASWGVQAESSAARAGFCGGRNPLTVLVPTEELHAAFSKGLEGPFIVDLALRYDTSEQAEKLMDLVAETLETCRTYDENGSQITLSPLDFPKLGDSTFAAHLTGATSLGPLEGDLVWVRKGDRVMSISTVAFGDFDVDLLKLVSEAAARRL